MVTPNNLTFNNFSETHGWEKREFSNSTVEILNDGRRIRLNQDPNEDWVGVWKDFMATPGQIIEVSAFMKFDSGSGRIAIRFEDSAGNPTGTQGYYFSDTVGDYKTVKRQVPKGTHFVRIIIGTLANTLVENMIVADPKISITPLIMSHSQLWRPKLLDIDEENYDIVEKTGYYHTIGQLCYISLRMHIDNLDGSGNSNEFAIESPLRTAEIQSLEDGEVAALFSPISVGFCRGITPPSGAYQLSAQQRRGQHRLSLTWLMSGANEQNIRYQDLPEEFTLSLAGFFIMDNYALGFI